MPDKKEDSIELLENPIPPAIKLKHLDDIRKEQALVYRQAKYGLIKLNKGKELSLMLRKLAETVNEIDAQGDNRKYDIIDFKFEVVK